MTSLGKWFTEAVEGAGKAASTLLRFGRGALDVGRTLVNWGGRVASIAKSVGLDGRNLVTLASAFFAAWAVSKVAADLFARQGGFASAGAAQSRMSAVEAEIAERTVRSNTIVAASRIEQGDLAGDEGARRELADLLRGAIQFEQARKLLRSVVESGGSEQELRRLVGKEKVRRKNAAAARQARTSTAASTG
ncbi:hypothetical protein [Haliangium sp.]|uniref:hypothetical protein n=1 Tax=Haliangium sp. TaxID=2663208 RepID=UPI003D13A260